MVGGGGNREVARREARNFFSEGDAAYQVCEGRGGRRERENASEQIKKAVKLTAAENYCQESMERYGVQEDPGGSARR